MNGTLIDIGTITEDRLTWDLRRKIAGLETAITSITSSNIDNSSESTKTYTLTADLTLSSNTEKYLYIDPNGANRKIYLPSGLDGLIIIIKNIGTVDTTYYLEINNYLGTGKEHIKSQTTKGYVYLSGVWKPLNDRFIDFGYSGNEGVQSDSSHSNKAPFVTVNSIRSLAIGTDAYVDGDYSVAQPTSKLFNDFQFSEGGKDTELLRLGEIGRNVSNETQHHYNARVNWSKVTATAFGTFEMFLNGITNERFTMNDNSIATGLFVLNGLAEDGSNEHYVTFRLLTLKRLNGANTVNIANNIDLFTATPNLEIQSSFVANTATGNIEVWVTNGGVSYNRDMYWTATFYYTETKI